MAKKKEVRDQMAELRKIIPEEILSTVKLPGNENADKDSAPLSVKNSQEEETTFQYNNEADPSTEVQTEKEGQSPEDKVAEMFAGAASLPRHHGKTTVHDSSYSMEEVLLLEAIALFFFFLCMKSDLPSVFSLVAVLIPAIAGITYRVSRGQLTLREAVSRCKTHIFISVFNFICIILSTV